MNSPARMKNGTAISTKLSAPPMAFCTIACGWNWPAAASAQHRRPADACAGSVAAHRPGLSVATT
jgi:hypothetical protein